MQDCLLSCTSLPRYAIAVMEGLSTEGFHLMSLSLLHESQSKLSLSRFLVLANHLWGYQY